MKTGTVALIGRPNVGKSTLVNNLIGQKVAITSPKPQTTRFPIQAVYEDERGQIVFVDTPGIFRKTRDTVSKTITHQTVQALTEHHDVTLYIIDPTRKRDFEEGRVLGIVRKLQEPKVLVYSKADVEKPKFEAQYKFLEDEFNHIIHVSGLEKLHLKGLLNLIFELLPEKEAPIIDSSKLDFPVINIDSKTYIAELIREKVFLQTRHELPYTTTVVVEQLSERKDGTLYVKAQILTTDPVYKRMLIGSKGQRIKEIGSATRHELETARGGRKVYLELEVVVDKHWPTTLR